MSNNDITGDRLVSRTNTKSYSDNYDLVFGAYVSVCRNCGTTHRLDDEIKCCDAPDRHVDRNLNDCCPHCKTVQ